MKTRTVLQIFLFLATGALAGQRWDFDSGTEGWTATNMTGLTASGGILSATSSGNDPYFISPAALGIDLTGITEVRLRFKNPSSVPSAAIYFTTAADPSFVGNFVNFPVSTSDTEFHEYTVSMAGHADWSGTLNRLRLDLPNNADSNGALIELDWCEVGNTQSSGAPNIIMILADDLGWNDTSINGSTFYQTPNLERLAAAGMRFINAYAANPLCSPTRASILTGQYPGRLRLTTPSGHLAQVILDPIVPATAAAGSKLREPQSRSRLPNETITYAETLKANGYATAFMGKWHLGSDPYLPDNQGFDTVVGGRQHSGPPGGYFSPFTADSNLPASPAGTHVNDLLVDEAIHFINANTARPFLLNLWFYDVHAPFEAKADLKARYQGLTSSDGRQRCPTMGAMVESMDTGIGRVIDRLQALGLTQNTIIIFYSDNGGNMYDWVDNALPTHNWPLRHGKASIHEGGSKVPCIIFWPGHTTPASTSAEYVSSIDLYPTILEMAGLSPDPAAIVDGVSMLPAIAGTGSPRDTVFCHFPHSVIATGNRAACSVLRGAWKLIRFFHDNPDTSHRYELYDLANDPSEQSNLAASNPALVTELDALITLHLTDTGALVPVPNAAYSPPNTGWEPNDECRSRLVGPVLQITSSGFVPAIVTNSDLSRLGPPASLELHMRSRSFGNGRVAWRLPGQTGFPAGQSMPFTVTHDNVEHRYLIPIPAGGPVEALSIQPGSDASQSEITRIVLRGSDDAKLREWAWTDSDGDGKLDHEETSIGRDPNNAADLGFEFETDGDFEGWNIGSNVAGGEISSGSFRGTATNGDPQFQNLGFSYPAASVPDIALRLKAASNGDVQLFFATDSSPSFAGQFLTRPYTGNGDWQTLVFHLPSHPNYSGTVRNLRIDPISTATSFQLDWIRASDGDADNDGVPDGDELAGDADGDGLQNYLDPDSDNDGQSDLLEFLAGSDMLSAASRFTLQASASDDGGHFHIDFPAISRRIYTLEKRNDETGLWDALMNAGPFPAPLTHRFSAAAGGPRGIFRVRIESAP